MTQSKYHLLFLFILSIQSCVDEISIENNTKFKSALVVEATITNEEKIQEILLTRTYGLNDEGPSSESDAIVKIIDADGFEYDFEETSPGKYKSLEVFAAQPNIDYNIAIITKNGRIFSSKTQRNFGKKCMSLLISLLTKLSDIWFGLAGDSKIGLFQNHFTRDREKISKK